MRCSNSYGNWWIPLEVLIALLDCVGTVDDRPQAPAIRFKFASFPSFQLFANGLENSSALFAIHVGRKKILLILPPTRESSGKASAKRRRNAIGEE